MIHLPPSDFLYGRKGPWPQPATAYPLGEAPQVLHLPGVEKRDFLWKVGLRYQWTLATWWPNAVRYATRERDRRLPDDGTFRSYLLDTLYSRFLHPLEPGDLATFAPQLATAGTHTRFWKVDFTAMEVVDPLPGTWIAPTVSLVRQDGDESSRRIVAVWCAGNVFTPDDGNAWDLCKAFVLQGASYHVLFVVHPALHFPMDSVNAITKTAVPRRHLLFRTLFPHTRFSLVLNHSVLEGRASVVNNRAQATVYDPLTADADKGLRALFAAGYVGYQGKASYPEFCYRCDPPTIPSAYGRFLRAYYDTFLHFTTRVAHVILRDDPRDEVVRYWGHHIGHWLQRFPEPEALLEPATLARVMARYIWDVSVGHATDHQSFSAQIPTVHKYLRIRVPPPTSASMDPIDPRRMTTRNDLFRAALCEEMFFRPSTVTPLVDTRYDFDCSDLSAAATELHNGLVQTASTVEHDFMRFDEFPASIQY